LLSIRKAQAGKNYPIVTIANYVWHLLQGITFFKKNAKKMAEWQGFIGEGTTLFFRALF
jgi:hypothetical protein